MVSSPTCVSSPADALWSSWLKILERSGQAPNPLLAVCDRVRDALGAPGAALEDEWRPLGVSVIPRRMASAGACSTFGGRRAIYVRATDHRRRQRFTVAHELAHLLWDFSPGLDGVRPHGQTLENLCDEFAHELLAPRRRIEKLAADGEVTGDVGDILNVAGSFGVSLAVAIVALRPLMSAGSRVLLCAEYRGHSRRPEVLGYRVRGVAAPDGVFLPVETRLTSLGMVQLAAQARLAPHRARFSGIDTDVQLWEGRQDRSPKWQPHKADVAWDAYVLDKRHTRLLVALEVQLDDPDGSRFAPRGPSHETRTQ